MTSVRKRLQFEKRKFQEELNEGLQIYEDSKYHHDYEDYDDYYNDLLDDAEYYDDYEQYDEDYDDEDYDDEDYDDDHYEDDCYNHYFDDFDDYYGLGNGIDDYMNTIQPGNHIKNNRTGDIYLYTEDYKYVNILTGKYETPNYWYDYLEIVL